MHVMDISLEANRSGYAMRIFLVIRLDRRDIAIRPK